MYLKTRYFIFNTTNWALFAAFAIFSFVSCQRGLSFIILLLAAPVILYQGSQFLYSLKKPEQHVSRISAIIIVMIAVLVVYGVHGFRDYNVRKKSEHITEAIEKFRLYHDRYPNNLAEVNIDDETLRIPGLYYSFADDRPALVYDATFILGDYWLYNFSTHQWMYVSP
jgi:predicted membrane protein